jgi:hypothetical protein
MKRLFKKLAGILVTWYYSRLYNKAVKLADEQHERKGETFYVIDHIYKGQMLSVVNRGTFRRMKHDAQRWTNPNYEMYYAKEYNLSLVKEGCWYRTPDRSGNNGLSKRDIEVRRLALVRIGLVRAKLLDIEEQTPASHDAGAAQNN